VGSIRKTQHLTNWFLNRKKIYIVQDLWVRSRVTSFQLFNPELFEQFCSRTHSWYSNLILSLFDMRILVNRIFSREKGAVRSKIGIKPICNRKTVGESIDMLRNAVIHHLRICSPTHSSSRPTLNTFLNTHRHKYVRGFMNFSFFLSIGCGTPFKYTHTTNCCVGGFSEGE
jgi:hypothetical protein